MIGEKFSVLFGEAAAGMRLAGMGPRLRLGLPLSKEGVGRALALYQPQTMKGRLFVAGLKGLSAVGGLRFLPKVCGEGAGTGAWDWVADGSSLGALFGNPSHAQQRAILSYRGEQGWEIAKLVSGGEGLLGRERELMERARELGVGVPQVRGMESAEGVTALRMEYVESAGGAVSDGVMVGLLEGMLLEGSGTLESWGRWAALEGMLGEKVEKGTVVRRALGHGDFARWNLRRGDEGWVLLDWEFGDPEGLAGLDLVHYISQEEELVNGGTPGEVVERVLGRMRAAGAGEYLRKAGWAGRERDLLMIALADVTDRGQQDRSGLLDELKKEEL
ncbi:MAG: hypothetical protein ACSHYF_11055 [Verrucomicrobiaceae bacterium]